MCRPIRALMQRHGLSAAKHTLAAFGSAGPQQYIVENPDFFECFIAIVLSCSTMLFKRLNCLNLLHIQYFF